jgi:uncharacterized protein
MTRRRRLLRIILFLAVAVVLVYAAVSYYVADTLTRPVRWPIHTSPAAYGLPYEEVRFNSAVDDILLSGWFVDTPGSKTIMVLHGVSSARDNYINMEVGKVLAEHGYDLLLFDFRGHGASGGDRSTLGEAETRDIAGALGYLKSRGVTEVGTLGYSMGASAELLAAPDHPEMRAIIADSAFSDLFSVIERQRETYGLPNLFNPGVVFASQTLFGLDILGNEPKRAIGMAGDRPILLIHADSDPLIPVSEARELQQAAHSPNVQLWVTDASGHVASFADNREEYLRRVTDFFDKNLR